MVIFIELSGIVFRIRLPYPVEVQEGFAKFAVKGNPDRWDADIEFIRGCEQFTGFREPCLAEDEQMRFYSHAGLILCAAKGGSLGPMAYTVCDVDGARMACYLNACYPPLETLGTLVQLVPLRWFLARKGVLLLHASQILVQNRGVLFAAPSGTGKTTQAGLWRQHRGARVACNDRVLLRDRQTWGFPYDGAQPVFDPEVQSLGAVVCLGQAEENRIVKLRPAGAVARLMQIALFDAWDPAVRDFAAEQLLGIVEAVPVYQLDCTPDETAVACLEEQLRKDGVIL